MFKNRFLSLFDWLFAQTFQTWLTTFLSIALIIYIYRQFTAEDEDAVPYTVDIPQQLPSGSSEKPPSTGSHVGFPCIDHSHREIADMEQLEDSSRSLIRCYCPTNGSVLEYIEPDGPKDIDRKISTAGAAQREWAQTSFSQRRRVLKTMLKSVLTAMIHAPHIMQVLKEGIV